MKTKLTYGVVGAIVWGGAAWIIQRYVLDIHGAELTGVSVAAAVLGGISAYRESRSNK